MNVEFQSTNRCQLMNQRQTNRETDIQIEADRQADR